MLPSKNTLTMQTEISISPRLPRCSSSKSKPCSSPIMYKCRTRRWTSGFSAKATDQLSPREENTREMQNYKEKVKDIQRLATEGMNRALEEAKSNTGDSELSPDSADTSEIQRQLKQAIQDMQVGLVERDTEVRLMLLAALSGEHILFIGPPGTAKSELGRRLSRLYKGSFFERLLTRFSVPEELFGPLSMRELENDQYVRQTNGYLPEASVAFIDEIFKANSAILNTLLTILNERLFDNGSERHPVPLVCMVGASNELPESEELDALYDRFLLRRKVEQVSTGGLVDLLSDPNLTVDALLESRESSSLRESIVDLSHKTFKNIRRDAIKAVSVPDDVKQLLVDVRSYLQDSCNPPVYVSDRRLLKSVALLKVAAYTSGRKSVSPYDCLLLQHVLWQEPGQSERIREFLISKLAADERTIDQTDFLFKGMFARACQAASIKDSVAREKPAEELLSEVRAMKSMLISKMASVFQSTSEDPEIRSPSIWSSDDDQDSVSTALAPKLMKAQKGVQELLFEVVTLEVMLGNVNSISAYNLVMTLPLRWEVFMKNPQSMKN